MPPKGNKERKPVTQDPRFASVHSDPRFYTPKKRDMKVTVDSRFKDEMRKNKDFKQQARIDKYGRRVEQEDNQLSRLYNLSDSDDDSADSDDSDDSDDGSSAPASAKAAKKTKPSAMDRARGEGASDVSDSSDSDSGSDSESENELEEELALEDTTDVATGDESHTLAAVNLDWDNVRAVDLMATFAGFVPPKGEIRSISIYPSEYGKDKMAEEELKGPDAGMFEKKKPKKRAADSDSDDSDDDEAIARDLVKEDTGEEVNSKSFRKYQLQRMRYYYAVIVCSNVATARALYQSCDGAEYESTANFFDLRYVPADMTFDDAPRDVCTRVPANYKPQDFETAALQHSKVKLTWDETPAERQNVTLRAFSKKEMDNEELKAYLASDSESEGEDRADLKAKYQSLLAGTGINRDEDGEEDVDMEITFTPGLNENGPAKKASSDVENETTLEKYKRKEKERRSARISRWHEGKEAREDEEEEAKDKDKKGKGKKGKKGKKGSAEDDAQAAQLALLMDEDDSKHFDMKDIIKAEKNALKRGKYQKKDVAKDNFEMPVNDDRFTAVFDDHDFAIDPSRPGFTRTKAMDKLLDERRKRQDKSGVGLKRKTEAGEEPKSKKTKKGGDDLESLVERVKRKQKRE